MKQVYGKISNSHAKRPKLLHVAALEGPAVKVLLAPDDRRGDCFRGGSVQTEHLNRNLDVPRVWLIRQSPASALEIIM